MIILSVALLQGDGGVPLVCEVVNLAASDYPKCSTVAGRRWWAAGV